MKQGKRAEHADGGVSLETAPVFIDLIVALFYVTHLFDIYLAFIILTFTIVYMWLGVTITNICQTHRRTYAENSRAESKTVMESVANWPTVTYFSRVPYERSRYDAANRGHDQLTVVVPLSGPTLVTRCRISS